MPEGREDPNIFGRDFTRRAALVAATAGYLPHELPERPAISPERTGGRAPDGRLSSGAQDEAQAKIQASFRKSETALPPGPYRAPAGTMLDSGNGTELADPLRQTGGYMRALQVRGVFQGRVDQLFDEFDVAVAPSLLVAATNFEANLETDLSFARAVGGIGNLCGLPAGIQSLARARNDRAVVAAASGFQQRSDRHRKRPPIP
jgi:hypothetical protein